MSEFKANVGVCNGVRKSRKLFDKGEVDKMDDGRLSATISRAGSKLRPLSKVVVSSQSLSEIWSDRAMSRMEEESQRWVTA